MKRSKKKMVKLEPFSRVVELEEEWALLNSSSDTEVPKNLLPSGHFRLLPIYSRRRHLAC